MVAPADPADAPCRPPHFSKHPTAGLSRRSTAPHPKASASGRSSLRPTPSRGSPDGATTRYGKPLEAGVNNSLPASHKNLWKTGYPTPIPGDRCPDSAGRGMLAAVRGAGLAARPRDRAGRLVFARLHRGVVGSAMFFLKDLMPLAKSPIRLLTLPPPNSSSTTSSTTIQCQMLKLPINPPRTRGTFPAPAPVPAEHDMARWKKRMQADSRRRAGGRRRFLHASITGLIARGGGAAYRQRRRGNTGCSVTKRRWPCHRGGSVAEHLLRSCTIGRPFPAMRGR